MRRFNQETLEALKAVDFEALDRTSQFDLVLFERHLRHEIRSLDLREVERRENLAVVPFADEAIDIEEDRKRMLPMNAREAADRLNLLTSRIEASRLAVKPTEDVSGAVTLVEQLKACLTDWHGFYAGYDPEFNWWAAKPFEAVCKALDEYISFLRKDAKDGQDPITGRPAGREALVEALEHELIPYSPEELIAIGEREYAWCEQQFKQAAQELGFGDDWMAAMQAVKNEHMAPGKQPEQVKKLALEAIEYVEEHDLVTVPDLAKETWRMAMMSPQAQKTNPFFLGGEQIIVSYPTDSMSHNEKLMSMRGNNAPFSRATVQHELIPGHHLQMYMTDRRKPYRKLFSTPFWIEGWTINWEMVLWDLGFPRTPQERIGMLFWRIHRAARIVFSIKFHLGQMSAQECIDMLVDRVGHERANAEGEVRRSIKGAYPPLYQAAYMIGGIQFRAMRRELVDTGRMTLKQFHDAVMQENNIPPAILHSILRGDTPLRNPEPTWRFDS